MSPEFEGPELDPERADLAPRRVKHLIVLPGGGEPAWDNDPEPEDPPDAESEPAGGPSREAPAAAPATGSRLPLIGAQAAAATAESLPATLPLPQTFRLKLKVISRTVTSTRAPGMPFIIFASGLVTLAVLALVVLHVMVDQASFKVDALDARVAQQDASLQQLRYATAAQEAPARVAAAAAQLGLVPGSVIQTVTGPGPGTVTSTATSTATATATVTARLAPAGASIGSSPGPSPGSSPGPSARSPAAAKVKSK